MSYDTSVKTMQDNNVMTVERLRKHLFGGPQVPFWNYDPAQLTFGVEIEYFIARTHKDGTYTLATKEQYLEVMEHLKKGFGFSAINAPTQLGRVSKDTEFGFIAVKPDFAWHILEIALPPRGNLLELTALLEKVLFEIDSALKKSGLSRLNLSCLPDVPVTMDLVELDRLRGHINVLQKQKIDSMYAVPTFPALIVATHVHLNVLEEGTYALLPDLYKHETEARDRYSRTQVFRGISTNTHRENFYRTSLGPNYKLCDIPAIVPASLAEYCDLFNNSEKLFPNDMFFEARDLTSIRPTRFGTLEFRSGCSFLETSKIIEIVQFRMKSFLMAFYKKSIEVKNAASY